MIKKKLTSTGNSYGIIIPKIFLQEMGINPILDNEVELEVVDKVLRIKKADKQD